MNTSLINWKLRRVEIQTTIVWKVCDAQQEAAVIHNLYTDKS